MPSTLKSETARANGAKSRGPVTPEGRARSAANSLRHGFASSSVLIAGESDQDFQLLHAEFRDQFQPRSGVEANLVEVMVIARWRLRRLLSIETRLFDLEMKARSKAKAMEPEDRLALAFKKLSDHGNSLTLLIRYEGSLNRSYDKAWKQLLLLKSTRAPGPPLGSFCIFEQQATEAPSGEESGALSVFASHKLSCGRANVESRCFP